MAVSTRDSGHVTHPHLVWAAETPRLGGRACIGTNQQTGECNVEPCPG